MNLYRIKWLTKGHEDRVFPNRDAVNLYVLDRATSTGDQCYEISLLESHIPQQAVANYENKRLADNAHRAMVAANDPDFKRVWATIRNALASRTNLYTLA